MENLAVGVAPMLPAASNEKELETSVATPSKDWLNAIPVALTAAAKGSPAQTSEAEAFQATLVAPVRVPVTNTVLPFLV